MRLGTPLLAAGACLALVGCSSGGGSSSSAAPSAGGATGGSGSSVATAGGNTGGGGNSAACTAFAAAYQKFLARYAPPQSQTGREETPLQALASTVTSISATGQLGTDLSNLSIDANLIATGSTQGDQTTPPSAFNSDLQAVGQDCGTTYTPPPASLL